MAQHMLESSYQFFLHVQEETGLKIHGLATMARTLRTAERCLGVDSDQYKPP